VIPTEDVAFTRYIRDQRGREVAFLHGRYLHALRGHVVAIIDDRRVLDFDGHLLGWLRGDRVIDSTTPDRDLCLDPAQGHARSHADDTQPQA
jgi:hypothetical protein